MVSVGFWLKKNFLLISKEKYIQKNVSVSPNYLTIYRSLVTAVTYKYRSKMLLNGMVTNVKEPGNLVNIHSYTVSL